jgi:hypothetical protein
MIHAFPKIFTLGTIYIKDIFNEDVEITEKIDGSQFVFGLIDGKIYMRSKGKEQYPTCPDKMFKEACAFAWSLESKLPNNMTFFCEYMNKPKHNALAYDRIPKNYLALFGVADKNGFISKHELLSEIADKLDIDVVPLIYRVKINKTIYYYIYRTATSESKWVEIWDREHNNQGEK